MHCCAKKKRNKHKKTQRITVGIKNSKEDDEGCQRGKKEVSRDAEDYMRTVKECKFQAVQGIEEKACVEHI